MIGLAKHDSAIAAWASWEFLSVFKSLPLHKTKPIPEAIIRASHNPKGEPTTIIPYVDIVFNWLLTT